jgi:hypothetical protein
MFSPSRIDETFQSLVADALPVFLPKRFGGLRFVAPFLKRIGGLSVLSEMVPAERCTCGNTVEECNAEWDVELGIVSHAAEDYRENLNRVRGAEMAGRDPYHWRGRIGLSLALPVHGE